jgi:UDP-N-acetylmuramyl pentapeptide phosphotransferase/UDP-N-acetylglucosamine-1-phosphate transferase
MVGITSFLMACLVVWTQRWHGSLTADHTDGIQKMHIRPTARVGGVPVFLALVLACWWLADDTVLSVLGVMVLAGVPAFVFGLAEDVTKRVGVSARLMATMASGVLAWMLSDISLARVDIWGIDWLLQWSVLSVAFTVFAVAGVANAINIIDGMNGLASLASVLMLVALAVVAHQAGDASLVFTALAVAASVLGFFFINWPLGKIFLGDGGAYFIGFCVAWISVLLIVRHSEVSAFAALLICVHPVTEVLFSVYRRRKRHTHPGQPDRMHFHSLFKRRYVKRMFSGYSLTQRNSVTGLMVGLMSGWGLLWVPWAYDSTFWSIVGTALYVLLYVILYLRMVRHKWLFMS